MKQIKKRRRILRLGNPIGFSLFCLVCLALIAGVYLGISWAIKNGPGVVKAMRTAVQEEVMATATVEPSREPKDELLPTPTPTPEVKETPALGTPDASTPSPEPSAYVSAGPAGDIGAALYGQIIGIDPSRDSKSKYTSEAAYNLQLATHLKRYLESQGATVVLSRDEETKGGLTNEERGRIFKNANCTYVIRLMCNHINSKTSACYLQTSKTSKEFGQNIIDAYTVATGMRKQRGGKKKDGVEIKTDSVASECGCPCVLLILGNWDNSKDKRNLQDEVFMDRICEGIFNGLVATISGEPVATATPVITDPPEPTGTPVPAETPASSASAQP